MLFFFFLRFSDELNNPTFRLSSATFPEREILDYPAHNSNYSRFRSIVTSLASPRTRFLNLPGHNTNTDTAAYARVADKTDRRRVRALRSRNLPMVRWYGGGLSCCAVLCLRLHLHIASHFVLQRNAPSGGGSGIRVQLNSSEQSVPELDNSCMSRLISCQ